MKVFLRILVAGLGCAALGSGLGWLIGMLSPEFIALVVQKQSVAEPERLGAAMGLVSGLLLGVIAMAFGHLVEPCRVWAARITASKETPQVPVFYENDQAKQDSSDFHVRPA